MKFLYMFNDLVIVIFIRGPSDDDQIDIAACPANSGKGIQKTHLPFFRRKAANIYKLFPSIGQHAIQLTDARIHCRLICQLQWQFSLRLDALMVDDIMADKDIVTSPGNLSGRLDDIVRDDCHFIVSAVCVAQCIFALIFAYPYLFQHVRMDIDDLIARERAEQVDRMIPISAELNDRINSGRSKYPL